MMQFVWQVPVDHPSFAGHFPGYPILPGVVLLDQLQLGLATAGISICEISNAKFTSPALPGETLNFITEAGNANTLRFRIESGERTIASGSVRLAGALSQ